MDKIEKIKEWVKKQKKEELARNSIGVITGKTLFVDANELLSFLDTLSEEPVQKFNTDKLQEIAKPATPHKKPTPEDRAKFMEELHEYAESKKPDKSLEGEIRRYKEHYIKVKECGFSFDLMDIESTARHFAEWQKQQMLKDAVEAKTFYLPFDSWRVTALVGKDRIEEGDKIRIVVLKEEE